MCKTSLHKITKHRILSLGIFFSVFVICASSYAQSNANSNSSMEENYKNFFGIPQNNTLKIPQCEIRKNQKELENTYAIIDKIWLDIYKINKNIFETWKLPKDIFCVNLYPILNRNASIFRSTDHTNQLQISIDFLINNKISYSEFVSILYHEFAHLLLDPFFHLALDNNQLLKNKFELYIQSRTKMQSDYDEVQSKWRDILLSEHFEIVQIITKNIILHPPSLWDFDSIDPIHGPLANILSPNDIASIQSVMEQEKIIAYEKASQNLRVSRINFLKIQDSIIKSYDKIYFKNAFTTYAERSADKLGHYWFIKMGFDPKENYINKKQNTDRSKCDSPFFDIFNSIKIPKDEIKSYATNYIKHYHPSYCDRQRLLRKLEKHKDFDTLLQYDLSNSNLYIQNIDHEHRQQIYNKALIEMKAILKH